MAVKRPFNLSARADDADALNACHLLEGAEDVAEEGGAVEFEKGLVSAINTDRQKL